MGVYDTEIKLGTDKAIAAQNALGDALSTEPGRTVVQKIVCCQPVRDYLLKWILSVISSATGSIAELVKVATMLLEKC